MENRATARVARTSALVQICWEVSVAACRIEEEVWEEMVERRSWREGPGGPVGRVGDGVVGEGVGKGGGGGAGGGLGGVRGKEGVGDGGGGELGELDRGVEEGSWFVSCRDVVETRC